MWALFNLTHKALEALGPPPSPAGSLFPHPFPKASLHAESITTKFLQIELLHFSSLSDPHFLFLFSFPSFPDIYFCDTVDSTETLGLTTTVHRPVHAELLPHLEAASPPYFSHMLIPLCKMLSLAKNHGPFLQLSTNLREGERNGVHGSKHLECTWVTMGRRPECSGVRA